MTWKTMNLWEVNIKVDLGEVSCDIMKCIEVVPVVDFPGDSDEL
jgi:hypothetical protein